MAGKGKRPAAPESKRRSSGERTVPSAAQLQGLLGSRLAKYGEDVHELIGQGVVDPRAWIDSYAGFAASAIADIGDWVQTRVGGPLRTNREWIPRCAVEIPQGQRATYIQIELSAYAFLDRSRPEKSSTETPEREVDEVTLVASDFVDSSTGEVALPAERHLRIVPETIKADDDAASRLQIEVKLYNLGDLEAGVYFAHVNTRENARPVALLELEVH
jgi:hypothetical protein